MIMDTTNADSSGGISMTIPSNLLRPFQEAEANLCQAYKTSPDVSTLIRMWLACATPGQMQEEFEEAVMGLAGDDEGTDEGGASS